MVRYVYSVLRRRPIAYGMNRDRLRQLAEEIVREYLAAAMAKGWLSRQGVKIRVFRAYLQDQLQKFVCSYLRHQGAKKRGGGVRFAPNGLQGAQALGAEDPRAQFERGWIDVAVRRALGKLDCRRPQDKRIILDLIHAERAGRVSPDLAAELALTSKQLASRKHRAVRHFSEILALELREAVSDDEAWEEEWKTLIRYATWLRPYFDDA